MVLKLLTLIVESLLQTMNIKKKQHKYLIKLSLFLFMTILHSLLLTLIVFLG